MKLLILIVACSFNALLCAQELAPELAPLATKYKADSAILETQKGAAISKAQLAYGATLDNAERTATSAGKVDDVAAIGREREAMKSGLMPPSIPPELPKSLAAARKTYVDAVAKAATDVAPRKKAIDSEYLRALGALQAKAANNAELAKQIAAEKERLVANSAGVAPKSGSSKNAITNGSFDLAEANGRPKGWSVYGPATDETFKVVRDGANSVLRLTVLNAPLSVGVTQTIPVPERAKSMTFTARIRGKLIEAHKDDSNHGANVDAKQLSSEKKEVGWTLLKGGTDNGWKTFKETTTIKPGAKTVAVSCIGWWVSGTFDFDDIEVEFR